MFLRSTVRKKGGKEHRYWSIAENRRVSSGKVVQQHVLYLGEINDVQQAKWRRTVEMFDDGKARTVALFPEERKLDDDTDVVRIRLSGLSLHKPRQWGVRKINLLLRAMKKPPVPDLPLEGS